MDGFLLFDDAHRVIAKLGLWLGSFSVEIQEELESTALPKEYEFIVVSEHGVAEYDSLPGSDSSGTRYELDLLMIKWTSEGHAERQAVFSIFEEDWMKTNPTWRTVVLG